MRHERKDYNERIQEVGPVVMALVAHLTSLDRTIMVGAAHEVPLLLDEVVRWMEERGLALDAEPHIGEDEPVFLLRAKDSLAPDVVEKWAELLRKEGGDPVVAVAVEEWAVEMVEWSVENGGGRLPDTPHAQLAWEDLD